jgi:hypothetical protein
MAQLPDKANPLSFLEKTAARKAYHDQGWQDIILGTSIRNRINPPLQLIAGEIWGKDWRGQKTSRLDILRQGITPATSQNIYDFLKDRGSIDDAMGIGLLSTTGMDINTYTPRTNVHPKLTDDQKEAMKEYNKDRNDAMSDYRKSLKQ